VILKAGYCFRNQTSNIIKQLHEIPINIDQTANIRRLLKVSYLLLPPKRLQVPSEMMRLRWPGAKVNTMHQPLSTTIRCNQHEENTIKVIQTNQPTNQLTNQPINLPVWTKNGQNDETVPCTWPLPSWCLFSKSVKIEWGAKAP